jgi:hypothetical protein
MEFPFTEALITCAYMQTIISKLFAENRLGVSIRELSKELGAGAHIPIRTHR